MWSDLQPFVIFSCRNEGYRGFYKGLFPSLLRVTPACCVTFVVYENVSYYLRNLQPSKTAPGAPSAAQVTTINSETTRNENPAKTQHMFVCTMFTLQKFRDFFIICYTTYPVDRYGTWAIGHRAPAKGNQVGNNTFVVRIVQFFLTTRTFVM